MINLYLKNILRNNLLLKQKIKTIELYYALSKDERIHLTEDLFLAQFNRVIRKSPFYRNLYEKEGIKPGDIKGLDDLKKLPVINRKQIKDFYSVLNSGFKFLYTKTSTSGTTGSPLPIYRSFNSIITEQAYLTYFRKRNGLLLNEPVLWMRGDLGFKDLYKYDRFANILYVSSFNLKSGALNDICKKISTFHPKAVFAYPSSLGVLAHELFKAKLHIHIPLAFTSSETLLINQRLFVEKVLGCKIFDWYGNAERTIALEQTEMGYYVPPPVYSITEFENVDVITTNIHNSAFPLIRYKVEDQFEILENDTSDPTGSSIKVKSIEGRIDDLILLKDGSKIGRLSLAIRDFKEINFSQIIQRKPGEIDYNIVDENDVLNDDLKQKLKSSFEIYTGKRIDVNIRSIGLNDIIYSKAGKYKFIINQLNKTPNIS